MAQPLGKLCLPSKHGPHGAQFTTVQEQSPGRALFRVRKRLKENFQKDSASESRCVNLAGSLRVTLSLSFPICGVGSEPVGSCVSLNIRDHRS